MTTIRTLKNLSRANVRAQTLARKKRLRPISLTDTWPNLNAYFS
jgi:hypothetical protein